MITIEQLKEIRDKTRAELEIRLQDDREHKENKEKSGTPVENK